MVNLEGRITSLDVGLFDAVPVADTVKIDPFQRFAEELQEAGENERHYMRQAVWVLLKTTISRRYPRLKRVWRASEELFGGR